MRHPPGPAQYQVLAMLAGAVLWLSREQGRPETEVISEMAGALGRLEQKARKKHRTRPATISGGRAGDGFGLDIVAAGRELLSCAPVPGEGASPQGTTAPGGAGTLPALTALVCDPAANRYQSLALLAGAVMALSQESGRPEAEILDGLAASLRLSA
jgi:hypothetical protein